MTDFARLPCRDPQGDVLVVVEAPRGSPAKLKYDPTLGVFVFQRALRLGVVYPYDWGFVPGTRAEDGDPLDAMVVFDAATAVGVVIPSRPLGLVKIAQRHQGGAWERNDRVIVVPKEDLRLEDVEDLPKGTREDLERFFVLAADTTKKEIRVEGWGGAKEAVRAIDAAAKRYEEELKRS